MSAHAAALQQGAQELGLSLTASQLDQLLGYLDLVQKWNKVYNLTAVRGPDAMVGLHLLDCLAIIPPLSLHLGATAGRSLLDVGSGAGLPGVVIAICCPELRVDCVDTVAKKAAFIQQAAAALGLNNLRGVHSRVENLTDRYDVITARAFASLADFVSLSSSALKSGGVWLAMKGKVPDAEVAALPPQVNVFHVEQLKVPRLDAERCIVWMKPALPVT